MHCLTTRFIQKNLKLLVIFFIYFIILSTPSTNSRFLYLHKFLNNTSDQTIQIKTQNPLYYGTEGVLYSSQ